MEKYLYPIFLILSIALLILYICKTHKRWLATVCIRVIIGAIVIFTLNLLLPMMKITCVVGLNPITVTVIGLLGIPGLILLYGSVYFFTSM